MQRDVNLCHATADNLHSLDSARRSIRGAVRRLLNCSGVCIHWSSGACRAGRRIHAAILKSCIHGTVRSCMHDALTVCAASIRSLQPSAQLHQ